MYGSYRYGYGSVNPTVILIVALVFGIFMIATMWRIFTKAGVKGWKCLIPIYASYLQFDIAWEGSKFWVIFLGSLALNLLSVLLVQAGQAGMIIYSILAVVWMIYVIVIAVKVSIRMAHRFGKSTAFGVVGLLLFSVIGYAILAWGSADYKAARDLGDGILRSDADLEKDNEQSSDYWNKISNS